jgi:hypothetical protein
MTPLRLLWLARAAYSMLIRTRGLGRERVGVEFEKEMAREEESEVALEVELEIEGVGEWGLEEV